MSVDLLTGGRQTLSTPVCGPEPEEHLGTIPATNHPGQDGNLESASERLCLV